MPKAIPARPSLGEISGPPLPRAFYERDTVTVARDLLGQILVHQPAKGPICAGRIVEVEAYVREYLGKRDRAAHADRGLTDRTRVLFGPGGHAYVYFVYGMHECLNVVTEPAGMPGCVLIRALEPIAGIEVMQSRRPAAKPALLCAGPGNLTRAMGVSRRHYGDDLAAAVGQLTIRAGPPALEVTGITTRVGIRHGANWPLRFYLAENPAVTRHP